MHHKWHFLLAWPLKSISILILTPSRALCCAMLPSDRWDTGFLPPPPPILLQSDCSNQKVGPLFGCRRWTTGGVTKNEWENCFRLRVRSVIFFFFFFGDFSGARLRWGLDLTSDWMSGWLPLQPLLALGQCQYRWQQLSHIKSAGNGNGRIKVPWGWGVNLSSHSGASRLSEQSKKVPQYKKHQLWVGSELQDNNNKNYNNTYII